LLLLLPLSLVYFIIRTHDWELQKSNCIAWLDSLPGSSHKKSAGPSLAKESRLESMCNNFI